MYRRTMISSCLVATFLALASGNGVAQTAEEAVPKIASYAFGQSREPLTVVEDLVKASADDPDSRGVLAAELTALLGTDATFEAKRFACRQLALIGSAANVPALAALLESSETADMARYALERVPGNEADSALLAALPKAQTSVKTGIVNSLGERRCAAAVADLRALATDSNTNLAGAAIAALGKIGNADAADALDKAAPEIPDSLRGVLADANLACAARFRDQGKDRRASAIYQALYVPAEPRPVRVAALQGLVASKGNSGIDLVIDALNDDDTVIQGVAAKLVRELPGKKATRAFAKQLASLAPEGQVRLLTALALRGDSEALPEVRNIVQNGAAEVRVAGLEALGELGAPEDVALLARLAASEEDKGVRDGARRGLYTLRGENIDAVIIERIDQGDPEERIELIKASVERLLHQAVPLLIETAADRDESVRLAAYKALAYLAAPENLDAMVDGLVRETAGSVRAEAEKAIVSVARKAPEPDTRSRAVLAALDTTRDIASRCSLLKILGDLGDSRGLGELRTALQTTDATVQDTAVRALSQWPDASVLADLLGIVKTTTNPTHRILALRGYVRLLALPGDRPAAAVLADYRGAMDLAKRIDEKKTVLAGIANVQQPGALDLVAPYLGQEALRAEAEAATLKIGRAICGAYADEVKEAVTRVADAASNESALNEAKDILAVIDRFEGYITAWQVSGPYVQHGKGATELFDIVFPPETADAAGVTWSVMPANTSPDTPWLMNLSAALGGDSRVAYLRTTLVSPIKQAVRVELGSDDGIKVWLNGKLVHANNATRALRPGEDVFEVTLKKGPNPLLLKVTNGGGEWEACLRLRTPDGKVVEGLKTKLD